MVGVSRLSACMACRQGRKRCDEQKPVCTRCRRAGYLCEWYHESRFRFVPPSAQVSAPAPVPAPVPALTDRLRDSLEDDVSTAPEASHQARVPQRVGRPMELSWRNSRTPVEELGTVYSTLAASFISLASTPVSMISSTMNRPGQVPGHDTPLATPTTTLAHAQTLRVCSSREHMIWALLAALVSRSHHCDAQYDQSLVNFIMGRAIEALHADIARHGRLNTHHLQTMRYLVAAEVYRRDFVAAKVHLRAARNMLGTNAFDHEQPTRHLSGMFLRADIVAAAFSSERPVFPDVYDPGPPQAWLTRALYDTTTRPALQRLGSSLLDLPETVLPLGLAQIVEHVRMITSIVAISADTVHPSSLTACWLSARCDALHHRIWSVEPNGPRARAVQLALICWLTVLQSPLSAAKLMAEPLQRVLEVQKHLPESPPFRGTLMWILFFGAMIGLTQPSSWWMDELTTTIMVSGPEYQTRDVLLEHLRGYFFLEDLHRDGIAAVMSQLFRNP